MKNLYTPLRFILFFIISLVIISITSCKDDDSPIEKIDIPESKTLSDIGYIDVFTVGVLENFYLWSDEPGRNEMVESIFNTDTCTHPIAALPKALHHDDRWSMLTDNMTKLLEVTTSTETTLGMEVTPYYVNSSSDQVFILVRLVYAGSPADNAGVKRGDIFTKINNVTITDKNYTKFFENTTNIILGYGEISEKNELVDINKTIILTPIKMYEEPVLASMVFNINGKMVGYLAYNSFNEDITTLKNVFKDFKAKGVSELIVDLRYNTGGLVNACVDLASMIAPASAVESSDIFMKNVYNKALTEIYKKEIDKCFNKKMLEYNIDAKKVYFLVTSTTASASELLIIGLNPYVDVTVLGEITHGKFCSGLLLTPKNIFKEEFYESHKQQFGDWGMYVMVGSFSDKNGNNPCRPNGISPKYQVMDYALDGYQLGDKDETMLKEALELAGMVPTKTRAVKSSIKNLNFKKIETEETGFAILDSTPVKGDLIP